MWALLSGTLRNRDLDNIYQIHFQKCWVSHSLNLYLIMT